MSSLSKWDVYEVVKSMYMATGQVPTPEQLKAEFTGVKQQTVKEGMRIFNETIGG